jgi:hypothetical protein
MLVHPCWSIHAGPSMLVHPCWSIRAGPSMLVHPCWSIHAGPSMLVHPCWSIRAGPSMLVHPCWSIHAGPSMLVHPCWSIHAGPSMLQPPIIVAHHAPCIALQKGSLATFPTRHISDSPRFPVSAPLHYDTKSNPSPYGVHVPPLPHNAARLGHFICFLWAGRVKGAVLVAQARVSSRRGQGASHPAVLAC